MSTTYTENYNLGKQTNTADKFDMSIITDNMDKIDHYLKENAEEIDDTAAAIYAALSALTDRVANLEASGISLAIAELLSAPIVGAANSIALTDDMNKYDILVFRFGITAGGTNQQFENTLWVRDVYNKPLSEKFFISGYLSPGYGVYYGLAYADSKHFTVVDSSQSMWSEDRTIFGISGIKF